MTQLAFVIPAWNRPKQLEVCVESIASQIRPADDVRVLVLDDASDDPEVAAVCARMAEKYQSVEVRRHPQHSADYSDAFLEMFKAAPDAEWVWTFGDDDQLRPNALKFVLDDVLPKMAASSFVHVAETTRASGSNAITHANRLIDLCCEFGWVEMTGFITGNITRGSALWKAAKTPHWKQYARSAFVQSAALLEALHDERCAFVDIPLIATQENETSPETAKRWAAQSIGARYLNVVDCLEVMYDYDILQNRLPAKFFRYLNLHLWDRFIVLFLNDCLNQKSIWPSEAWDRVARFAKFLEDEQEAHRLMEDIEAARGLSTLWLYMDKNLDVLRGQIAELGERRSTSSYPYSFSDVTAKAPPSA